MHAVIHWHRGLLCSSTQQCCPMLGWNASVLSRRQLHIPCPYNTHSQQPTVNPPALQASADREALQQVAASLRKAALNLHPAAGDKLHGNSGLAHSTSRGSPTIQPSNAGAAQVSKDHRNGSANDSTSSNQTGALEGKVLDLYLGPLQLIQQCFTVSSHAADTANLSAAPRLFSVGGAATAQPAGISQFEFRILTPKDVDEVMDMYIEHGLNDSDPYWTRVWPSAIALAAHILANPSLVAGKRVADLGCGLGLAGLAAAAAGASEVVFLDREPLALECALLSALATCSNPAAAQGRGSHTVTAAAGAASVSEAGGVQGGATGAATGRGISLRVVGLHLAGVDDGPSSIDSGNTSSSTNTGSNSSSSGNGSSAVAHAARNQIPGTFSFHGAELSTYQSLLQQASTGVHQVALQGNAEAVSVSSEQTDMQATATASKHAPAPSTSVTTVRGQVFDWNAGPEPLLQQGGRYDVVLACDVLYEEAAVAPIAGLVPSILKTVGGYLLLADPPNRTARHRTQFLELLSDAAAQSHVSSGVAGRKVRPAKLVMEECSVVDSCKTQQLDPEMTGGMGHAAQTHGSTQAEVVPVQLMVFRSTLGNDTVGLKAS